MDIAGVLGRRTALPVRPAVDGLVLDGPGVTVLPARQTGTVMPDRRLRLSSCSDYRVADPLLTTVATAYGAGALCVVLTGRLDDAAAGVRAVKRHGGRTIVEDPVTAAAAGMPSAALATGCVDLVLPLGRIAHALIALAMAPGAADLFRVPAAPWARIAG
jgi:two-component system chemotaxis response regulator CheB